jgi:hypothetical protein
MAGKTMPMGAGNNCRKRQRLHRSRAAMVSVTDKLSLNFSGLLDGFGLARYWQ